MNVVRAVAEAGLQGDLLAQVVLAIHISGIGGVVEAGGGAHQHGAHGGGPGGAGGAGLVLPEAVAADNPAEGRIVLGSQADFLAELPLLRFDPEVEGVAGIGVGILGQFLGVLLVGRDGGEGEALVFRNQLGGCPAGVDIVLRVFHVGVDFPRIPRTHEPEAVVAGAQRERVGAGLASAADVRRIDAHILEADVVAAHPLEMRLEVGGNPFGGIEGQLHPPGVLLAAHIVPPVLQVLPNAVPELTLAGNAQGGVLAQGRAVGPLQVELIEAPVACVDIAASLAARFRLAGDEVDRAARGVAAIEGVLRAAQHFHPFQIVGLQDVHHGRVQRHFVRVQADAALYVEADAGGADAAQEDVGVGRPGVGDDLHIGHLQQDFVGILEAQALQGLAAEGRHGNADILQGFRALGGGDQDFLENLLRKRAIGKQHGAPGKRREHAPEARSGTPAGYGLLCHHSTLSAECLALGHPPQPAIMYNIRPLSMARPTPLPCGQRSPNGRGLNKKPFAKCKPQKPERGKWRCQPP